MHSGQYEPVPTESTTDLHIDDTHVSEPSKAHPRSCSLKKLLLISVTFVVLALASYKLGQWSVIPRNPISPAQETSLSPEPGKDEVALPPQTNDTTSNMPGNGKYSVG